MVITKDFGKFMIGPEELGGSLLAVQVQDATYLEGART
jgi:hypothetical protein